MTSKLRNTLEDLIRRAVAEGVTPSAVCTVASGGERLEPIAVGDAVRFGENGQELPEAERVRAEAGTSYDLASVTKIFTTITALSLVDDGTLKLDQPIGSQLPQYRIGAKSQVTLRHLLTHTSGLPGSWTGWLRALEQAEGFERERLLKDLLATELEAAPGSRFEYSCVGFNTVMALAETATGQPWAKLVQERLLDRLPTTELTGAPEIERCAATEFQPELGRGMVRGIVHDEAAWSLGSGQAGGFSGNGLCGNAGMFGTAAALLELGEALRTGLPGILSPGLAAEMWRSQLPEGLAEKSGIDFGHSLGLRIGQSSWVGDHPEARGHNGFTGTSLLVDQQAGISVVLLSNRVHPRRELSDVQAFRRSISDAVYQELAV